MLALQGRARNGSPNPGSGGAVVTTEAPRARHIIQAASASPAVRGNRVAIRHNLGRVVCVIEIVSPGNKASRSALRSFVEKSISFLDHGVHLLVVDLFPPNEKRDPQGIHKAIWDEIEDSTFRLSPEQPFTLAAYVATQPRLAYVEPVGVGGVLPDMPAYLDVGAYVPVPLEATYQAAYASCPEMVRAIVEGRATEETPD